MCAECERLENEAVARILESLGFEVTATPDAETGQPVLEVVGRSSDDGR